jgi:twitching motility protein PilT
MLLGPLLSKEREQEMDRVGTVEFPYEIQGVGSFHALMTRREVLPNDTTAGIDVVFLRGGAQRLETPRVATDAIAAEHPTTRAQAFAEPSDRDAGSGLAGLLSHAVALRASDLHLQEGDRPAMRIDGRLQPMLADPVSNLVELLGSGLGSGIARAVTSGRSVDTAFEISGTGRFRLNAYIASGRPCASIRLLPSTVPALGALQLPVPLDELIDLPHGLVIVCGPTGSGKSTTLASLAQEALRRRSIVLVTLEDPIEYRLRTGQGGSLVRQRELGRDVLDFPTGLRDALREDPDMLLIGEMRDADSIGLTLTAAETGHLVLASLHSRSAASAVERVIDTYPPERQGQIRVQLADCLRAVISQRLIPHASGEGRVPAVEVLRVSFNVANVIREGRTAQLATAMQSGRREGQLPLERCLADLVRAGQIRIEDAKAVANDPAALTSYLQG